VLDVRLMPACYSLIDLTMSTEPMKFTYRGYKLKKEIYLLTSTV